MDGGAKVILCPSESRRGEPLPEGLAPVAPALSERLGVQVRVVSRPKVAGVKRQKLAAELKTERFCARAVTELRQSTARMIPLWDIFRGLTLCDDNIFTSKQCIQFTFKRTHCSNVGVTKFCKEEAQ